MFKNVFAVSCILLVSSCMSEVFGFEEVKFESGTAFITLTRKPEKTENLLTNIAVVKTNQDSAVASHNAGQLLQSLPSIDISPTGSLGSQSTARIRNSTSDQVLVLINGLPTKGTSFGSDNLAHLLTDNIERIEIVYGPATVLYGANSVGGVMNIITKKATSIKPSINLGLDYGSFNTFITKFDADIKKDESGLFLTGTKQKSDGYRVNSAYDSDYITMNYGYELNSFNKITLQGQYLNKKVGIPGKNFTPVSAYNNYQELIAQTTNCFQLDKEYSFQAQFEHHINENTVLSSKLYSTFLDHTYDQLDTNSTLWIFPQTTKTHNKSLGGDIPHQLFVYSKKSQSISHILNHHLLYHNKKYEDIHSYPVLLK